MDTKIKRAGCGARRQTKKLFITLACALFAACPAVPPGPADASRVAGKDAGKLQALTTPGPRVGALVEQAPAEHGRVAATESQKKFSERAAAYFKNHPSRRIYVQLDKPLYQPGETIWLRAALLATASFTAQQDMGVRFELLSPKGSVVLSKRVLAVKGNAASDFELPDSVQGGEYTLRVVSDGGDSEQRTLMVNVYQPPRFKKKLDFVRKAYGVGDTVAATLEVKRPTGEPFADRELEAVLTLDGAELPRVKLRTDAKGAALVKVPLPQKIERGDGILTVLVRDAGLTESVTKRVPIVLNKLKLSFYPEGGDLVSGLPGRVYFYAQNMIDKPADVEGKVVDDHGQTMAVFTSFHDGMGRFDFTPATGRRYQAVITRPVGVGEKFSLPVAADKGCVLRSFDDFKGGLPVVRVRVACSKVRTVFVNALMREELQATASAEVAPGKPAVLHLKLNRPRMAGVLRLTVFSPQQEPLAERLVYRGWHQDLQIKITPDKKTYTPRAEVVLNVETRDLAGEPVSASLAMAVVDDTVLSYADDKTAHLLTHMLLEAELPGKIEEPNFYFKKDKPKAPQALDMLLGTRGWRRFEWQRVLQAPVPAATAMRADDDDNELAMAMEKAEGPQAALQALAGHIGRDKRALGKGMAPLVKRKAPAAPRPAPPMEARPERKVAAKKDAKPAAEPVVANGRAAPARRRARQQKRGLIRGIAADIPEREMDLDGLWDAQEAPPADRWAKVRVFPVPNYTQAYDGPRSDFRETLYWNPSVQTDARGRAQVRFFASDAISSFRVTTEGFAVTGLAGRNETVVQSKLPFFMELKFPLEVSAGDHIDLPLTLRNETTGSLNVALRSVFGAQLKLLEEVAPHEITLTAGQGRSLGFPLEVTASRGVAELQFEASALGLRDQVKRSIRVVPLGYPQSQSASGDLKASARQDFDLQGALDGSVEATVTLYPSPVGQMLTGIDSILREPHGCFEQTSSSNYPNIMVLSYLQEHDIAEPAVVDRASRLLTSGYKRLIGYESPKKGYEWFGGDPGHEALTAYGLLEFVDMKRVFGGVDSAMIARTRDWLLARRDGKGGFARNSRALDSFGGASPEVTNAYIVYALSEAGIRGIDRELAAVTQQAKSSSDPYILALVASAQLNSGGKKTASSLLSTLIATQKKDGSFVGTTHSITRSGGHGLAVETTSLAILALVKSGSHRAELQKAVRWLVASRQGSGGFGSTQATILALKAMVTYASASKQTQAAGEVVLLVNGKRISSQRFEKGRHEAIVLTGFASALKPGANKVELKLDSSASLPYTIDVRWRSNNPASSPDVPLSLSVQLARDEVKMGENLRLSATLTNTSPQGQPMTLARLGLPGGLAAQTWQLKELVDKKAIDFFETRAREVIVYWRALAPGARKTVELDLVAQVPGRYTAPASSAYLYYTAENKVWAPPVKVAIAR